MYPTGTRNLLLPICEAYKPKRNLTEIAWRVWWGRVDVPKTTLVRQHLKKGNDWWGKKLSPLTEGNPPRLSKKAIETCDKAKERNRDFHLQVCFEAITGQYAAPTSEDFSRSKLTEHRKIIEHKLGLTGAGMRVSKELGSWYGGNIFAVLQLVSDHSRREDRSKALRQADDIDLNTARNEVQILFEGLLSLIPIFTFGFGKSALGFAKFGKFLEKEWRTNSRLQAMSVLFWLSVRQSGKFTEAQDLIVDTFTQARDTFVPNFELLEALRDGVPALHEHLDPSRYCRRIFNDPAGLLEEAKLLRVQHGEAIDAFLGEYQSRPKQVMQQ